MRTFIVMTMLLLAGCCPFPMQPSDTWHIVREGETLEEISVQYYGTELNKRLIMEANCLKERGNKLKEGQRMKIPRRCR